MEIHKIQREILREISFKNQLSFSDFAIGKEIEADSFNYHLQALVKSCLLNKDNSKKYSLLPVTSAILEEYSGEERSHEYWKVLTSDNLEL